MICLVLNSLQGLAEKIFEYEELSDIATLPSAQLVCYVEDKQ